MQEDKYGFIYPVVDAVTCIRCGLCLKVCPELTPPVFHMPKNVYALSNKDFYTQLTTSSAGFSSTLSAYVINNDGVVYGCSQENFENVCHIRVDNIDDLEKLKSSKYVHSDISNTYQAAKQDLDRGITVLFTGTPCQIAGLLGFLRKPYNNLITMDVICHGVPPMKMLKEQVRAYSKTKNVPAKDIRVSYRWKESRHSKPTIVKFGLMTEICKDGKFNVVKKENDNINPYMRCFQTGISLRENCLQCPYARTERISDFTAADFWGIGQEVKSELIDNNGVTLLLTNTEKGEQLFKKIKNNFIIEEHTIEEAKIRNRCLTQPFPRLKERDRFLEIYSRNGLYAAVYATDSVYRHEIKPIVRLMRSSKYTNFILRGVNKLIRIARRFNGKY